MKCLQAANQGSGLSVLESEKEIRLICYFYLDTAFNVHEWETIQR